MLEDRILDLEINKNIGLAERIYLTFKKKGIVDGSSKEAFAFIITGLELIHNKKFTREELENIITDGRDDKNFDVIRINKNRLHIYDFSTKNPEDPEVITFTKSIEDFIFKKPRSTDYNTFNERLKKILSKYHKESNKIKCISVYMVRKSDFKGDSGKIKELKLKIEESNDGKFRYFNTRSISDLVTIPSNIPSEWYPSINKEESFIASSKKYAFVLMNITEVLKFKKKCDNEGLNLYNKNIRIFLDNKTLKKEIIDTLEKHPGEFHLYNNGLVCTVSKINYVPSNRMLISDIQIINGAQTINSIYEKYKGDLNNKKLKKAKILCKLIVADENLTKKVCETSNTQISIKSRELRSNDDIQLKLEKLINNLGDYQYIRKGKGKGKQIKKGKIFMDKFIQWYYAAYFKKPADAKNKKRFLFDTISGEYNKIVTSLRDNDKVIEKLCKVGLYVEDYIKKSRTDKGLLKDADFHIIATLIIKNTDLKDKNIDKIVLLTKTYIDKVKLKYPKISNNRIFTKSNDLLIYLLKNYK